MNDILCREHTINLIYKKQTIEIKSTNGCRSVKVLSEKDIDRKVVIWVDATRKKEFKFIGSLINILQNEISELSKLRTILKDISGHLSDLGWPIKLEFNIKRHVYVTMAIKSQQRLDDCQASMFSVPR